MRNTRTAVSLKPWMVAIAALYVPSLFAATPVNVAHKNASLVSGMDMKEISRHVGPNQTMHTRLQQTFNGYPVYGAEAILHTPSGKSKAALNALISNPKSSMNGLIYSGLSSDLAKVSVPFSKKLEKKATQHAVDLYNKDHAAHLSGVQTLPMVFVDENNVAHYAYQVSFFAEPKNGALPEVPTTILDAKSLTVLASWDAAERVADKHMANLTVTGGGFGGNGKTGQITYDGSTAATPSFLVTRDAATGTCYMQNPHVKLKRNRNNNPDNVVLSYSCVAPDAEHNNVFFSGNLIDSNGSFSTANGPLATEKLTRRMFQDWYGLPVVAKDGNPTSVTMVINYPMVGAIYADAVNPVISMGDGAAGMYYPFTTRDIVSHELGHAFTSQYTKFGYTGQGAAVGDAFGDMTAKALEFYLTGSNSWEFASDVMKNKSKALRYMDDPTKDCDGREPGDWCSIDHASQYKGSVYKHFASGVFNKAFFTLATTSGWNTKKAYDVMVAANMFYWTPSSDFNDAACGVVSATKDYGYDADAVKSAFSVVGVDTSSC